MAVVMAIVTAALGSYPYSAVDLVPDPDPDPDPDPNPDPVPVVAFWRRENDTLASVTYGGLGPAAADPASQCLALPLKYV
ncbi:hypothetical protein L249_5232, partial [Ophiocordyceps polyrhachis-furcata BCC 54312]